MHFVLYLSQIVKISLLGDDNMSFSKTIQMYIFDGNPNGRIMCELSNWNGRVYKISRNELSEFSQRDDAENTGVYFLFGKNDDNTDTVYIGEAERMYSRLKQHLRDTEYWSDCIAVISKDNLLNKAHVKYLENKFYLLAQSSGRAGITNSTVPTCSSISEYDEAMLEEFISNAKLLVNTLGYKVFDTIGESIAALDQAEPYFYTKAARGADAKGLIVADGFAVMKGSLIASSAVPSMSESLKKLRSSLLKKGIVDENMMFTRDHIFSSPSLAASVVQGRSANGRTEWRNAEHKSIKDIEES